MPEKIFISYRRDDTAANALGIGQYLERQFGHKNVFIDVDLRAGMNFPAVLEQRLAQCGVMLVLIGPGWLNASDANGQRRLDDPNDWVRLEIERGLKRGITIIPVRVGGAEMPARSSLPEDIRGLLNHQAAIVRNDAFRNDMAGLARDIHGSRRARSMSTWLLYAASLIGASIALALVARHYIMSSSTQPMRIAAHSDHSQIWKAAPGEWVMFASDRQPIAYYYLASSFKSLGTKVAFVDRMPLKPASEIFPEKSQLQGTYEDDGFVVDCTKEAFVQSEKTIFNDRGDKILHYSWGDPESLDVAQAIASGSILDLARNLACHKESRAPLIGKDFANAGFSYVGNTFDGAGEFFSSAPTKISGMSYQFVTTLVGEYQDDQDFSRLAGGQSILGLPHSFRYTAQAVRLYCAERKIDLPTLQYFDAQRNLVYAAAPTSVSQLQPASGSLFEMLLNRACGAELAVAGTYKGKTHSTEIGASGDQELTINVQQIGAKLDVGFASASGVTGDGTGILTGNKASIEIHARQTACAITFVADLAFSPGAVAWNYTTKECDGRLVKGDGTARKVGDAAVQNAFQPKD